MFKTISIKRTFVISAVFVLLIFALALSIRVNAAENMESKGEIDVYLIAGQSNAVGYGEAANLTATDERFTNGFDNVLYYGEHEHWDNDDNKPPLTFVPTKTGLGQNATRSGAEIGIASALGDNGKMNAVIKCAWGGTSIYNSTAETSLKYGTWTSPTYIKNHNISTEGNKCGRLYTWFLETVSCGLGMLEADGYTPVIKGIWWMQGEAETGGEKSANAYNELLTTLINDMRRDLSEITGTDQSTLPFVMGEITSNHAAFGNATPAYLDVVCKAQLDVAAALENVFVLDTTGLLQQDNWHYTADSQVTIGEKFIEIVLNASGDIPTAYGVVPKAYADATTYPLAMFKDGKHLASYSDWNTAMTEANKLIKGKARDAIEVQVVLIGDFVGGKFDNTSQMGGTLVIDLNGYTLSTGTADHLLNGWGKIYSTGKICDTNIVFKNGNIKIGKKIITSFGILTDSYPAEKTFSYRFDNVNFGYAEGSTVSNMIANSQNNGTYDKDNSLKMYVDMEFNNCTFDLETNAKDDSTKLFGFNESKGIIVQTVRINGGKIIKKTCAANSLYTLGTAEERKDSVSFGKYNGHYTTLELPSGTKPATAEYLDSNADALGKLIFAKVGAYTVGEGDGAVSKDVYELTCLTTKYGNIPASLSSIADYPFILFKFKGDTLEGVSGYSKMMGAGTNDGVFHYAKEYVKTNEWDAVSGYAGQKTAVILQRCDYTTLAGEVYENMAQVRGEVTYDLGGYKLSQNPTKAVSIFKFGTKAWGSDGMADGHADIFPTTFNIINGDIEIYSYSLMTLQMSPCSSVGYSINDKTYTINYNNITFSLASGATATNMFFSYWSGKTNDNDSAPLAPYFVNFNDCTFDLTKNVPAKEFKLFNISPISTNYICNTVTVNGGTIKSKYWDNYITVSSSGTYGSTFKFGKSETSGEYTSLEVPYTLDYPSYLSVYEGIGGKQLTFTHVSSEGMVSVYALGESIETKYCLVPHRYSDANVYPYIVIIYDGKGNITEIEGATKLLGTSDTAFNMAKNAVSTNKWNATTGYEGQMTAVILARRDYVLGVSEVYDNFAQIRGEVTFDLDGYTLSQARTENAKPLFFITSKPWEGVFPTTVNIVNGKLLTYNGAVFRLNMWTGSSSASLAEKPFTFNLEGVTIGLCEGATTDNLLVSYGTSKIESAWVGKEAIAPYFINLNDCIIDLETVKPASSITLFDISPNANTHNYISNNITVFGGEIKANSVADINFVTESQNGSTLTFNKTSTDNYTAITVSKDAEAPSFRANDGKLVFVKVSEGETTVTYRLRPVEFADVEYAPKMSITLATEFVMNVYVPVNYTQKFTFNGITYDSANAFGGKVATLEDGYDYYVISVALGSSEAASEIALVASVNISGVDATVTFTFSIPKYAAKVIAGGNDVEKTLAKDVLAYIKAAYEYFTEHNDKAEIERVAALVDSIIGDYKAAPVSSGATNTAAPVTSVTLNLSAKPTIRFYVADTAVEFYVNGKKVNTVTGVDAVYGAYVELDVYAYALSETITFADGGSYHITDFLVKSKGESHENLVNAFVKYVESAADYRNSVIGM